ncbi:Sec-independent protein translocase subunit TatA [Streptomyces guryensis]|uniref:Sec-independent protein translocase protein TatA n=1 Tax=Streptomyces guryensis TaxID=2886947 RepID=A0A9Q3Z3R6_9ACTN|nr:Sec-independent protein translocase subunit TatA [Streptomyces guryensis]MCD9872263.1 Sec-independent protein translocase subunit TatA [Streptomyces guryensis]
MLRNGLEPWHLLVLAIVIILLFGSKKLPEAARGLGKSMRILKSEAKAMKEDGAGPASAAQAPAAQSEPASSSDATAARVIQSSPGDAASARPVSEDSTVR